MLSMFEYAGVFVFAISGGIVAVRKDMDIFGVIVLGFLPAVGGGTIRDLVLGVPVFWIEDPHGLLYALLGALTAFFFCSFLEEFRPLRWADAFGLSLFAATGAEKTLDLGHGFVIVAIMAALTASAGGLLRDIVANREPLLLKEDIYATAAICGGLTLYLGHLLAWPGPVSFIAAMLVTFMIRAAAIVWGLSLPKSPFARSKRDPSE